MRYIEHKLDILTSSVVGATTDTNTDTTTSRQKPSFAETTAKAVVNQIEQSHRLPQQTTLPSPSPSGMWRHIERRQTETSEADDHKRSVIVLGAPFDESKTRIERNRVDTTFVRHLASTLGIDPIQVQRVHRFAKHPGNERPPVLKVTFMTEAAQDAALSDKSCLREETDLANVYIRPSHPKSTRDHINVLFYAASHETFDPNKIVKCVFSSYSETFELRYIIDGRVDWNTAIPFSEVTYASWKAAVAGRRRSASVDQPRNTGTRATVTDEWLTSSPSVNRTLTENVRHTHIYYANARSLRNKMQSLEVMLSSAEYCMLLFVETFLSCEDTSAKCLVGSNELYKLFTCVGTTEPAWGCYFLSTCVNTVQIIIPENLSSVEAICVDLKIHSNPRILCIYRPPNCTNQFHENMCHVISHCARNCDNIVMIGDFNLPLIQWSNSTFPNTMPYNTFAECINENSLTQHVYFPTRGSNILKIR